MPTSVNVIYHYEDGSWWADSPDIARWSADLIGVFSGRTVGGRLRLQVSAAFRGLLPDPPRVAAPAGGTPIACGS